MTKSLPARVAVVGLGYVGLPLATAFGRRLPTLGFDIDSKRVRELQKGHDCHGEMAGKVLQAPHLSFTDDPKDLRQADFIIVAVPTPVDKAKRPDLGSLTEASRLVGRNLPPGATVVYESTVYPGATEEVCLPILEHESGLKAGVDFKVGYSPERINPGDSEHTLEKIVKIVAAQDEETLEVVSQVYGLVVKAGVYKAPNIKTAEAAKVIENVQRDLNIALMNELAMLFHHMGLNTTEILEAARTKWNFLPFEPGLVGGHCIPVDPYYLTYKAEELGYHPEVILAGRRINDSMGAYIAHQTVKLLIQAGRAVQKAKILVLGLAFKENVPDVRNTRVLDLIRELESYGCQVFIHDPLVGEEQIKHLGLNPIPDPFSSELNKLYEPNKPYKPSYDAVILAVSHRAFREKRLQAHLALLTNEDGPGVLVDVKGIVPWDPALNAEVLYWSL